MCIPVYHEDGAGNLISCAQATLARAIRHALTNGASIINISGGQLTPTGRGDRFLEGVVHECADRNVLIVAAAGNDGCRCLHVPAAMPSTLAVGACAEDGATLPFSNYGEAYSKNGLLVLGQDVPGASPGGGIAKRTGTSFAAPIATGVAALLLSLQIKLGDEPDPIFVRRIMIETADPCDPRDSSDCTRALAGRLNVRRAAESVRRGLKPSELTRSGMAALARSQSLSRGHPPSQLRGVSKKGEVVSMSQNQSVTPSILGPDGLPAAPPPTSSAGISQSEMASGSTGERIGVAPQAASSEPVPSGVAPEMAVQPPGSPSQVAASGMPEMVAAAPAAPAAVSPATHSPVVAAHSSVPGGALAPQAYGGIQPSCGTPLPVQAAGAVQVQGCGCGASGISPSETVDEPIFAIGKLFYDFDSEARFDYFVQAMAAWWPHSGNTGPFPGPAAPWNAEYMIQYLLWKPSEHGSLVHFPDANALIWTLNIDDVPIYAIKPQGEFGFPMYTELAGLLWYQVQPANTQPGVPTKEKDFKPAVDRVSQAGYVDGEVRLLNGTVVPRFRPVWRGMFGWRVENIIGGKPPPGLKAFLERIYNEFRNPGISPQDRALNYSAFNAYNAKLIFEKMLDKEMFLDTVNVDRSTICRPDSDCWDVTWTFFAPDQTLTKARTVFQYTIDVSDVVPVTVGQLREWEMF